MALNRYDPKTGVYTPVSAGVAALKATATPSTSGTFHATATAAPSMSQEELMSHIREAQASLAANGTVNGKTPTQNLADVANQPGSGVKATPYIKPDGSTDYHIPGVADNYSPPTTNSTPTPTPQLTPTPTATPQPTAQPVSAGQSYQPPDYAALAAARTAAALAQKRSIAETQKGSLDRSFARDNQITNDNRTLQDFNNSNSVNRFTEGKQTWDKGITGRERTLVDENKSGNLAAQKAGIDDLLAAYESATEDEKVRIADELQARDRQYQLDLAQVTGTINGVKTAAQSNSDRTFNQQQQNQNFNQNLDTAKYGLDVKKQHIDLANKLTELFGVKVNPTSDPMESYAQVAGLSTTAAQKIAADAKQSTFDNAVKLALANNTITQTQANIMHQAQQIGISQQNADTASNNSSNSNANMKQDNLMNIWKATGKAPAGITGVAEGAPYTGQESASSVTQHAQSQYVTGFDGLTPEKRVEAFKNERSTIIADLGISGYNALYSMYFDAQGNPK